MVTGAINSRGGRSRYVPHGAVMVSASGRLLSGPGRLRGRWSLRFALGTTFCYFLPRDSRKSQNLVDGGIHLWHEDLLVGCVISCSMS